MKKPYNYVRFTLLLDADEKDDAELIKWLKKSKSKRNGYSEQIRRALLKAMEEQ